MIKSTEAIIGKEGVKQRHGMETRSLYDRRGKGLAASLGVGYGVPMANVDHVGIADKEAPDVRRSYDGRSCSRGLVKLASRIGPPR
jgi:hypothetical protein